MMVENRKYYRSEWAAFITISKLFGMSPETLRTWVRKTQVDQGSRPGITSDKPARLKQLERENKDLRRADAILKDGSIFFATELDGQARRQFITSMPAGIDGESSQSAERCSLPPAPTTPRNRGQYVLGVNASRSSNPRLCACTGATVMVSTALRKSGSS